MAAIEFWARVGPDRTLKIPAEVADHLGEDRSVRVVLLLPDEDEDRAWTRLAALQLLRAYADEDSIFDDLDVSRR